MVNPLAINLTWIITIIILSSYSAGGFSVEWFKGPDRVPNQIIGGKGEKPSSRPSPWEGEGEANCAEKFIPNKSCRSAEPLKRAGYD